MDAAIYTRLSVAKKDGGLGLDRQEELCREVAKQRGWRVAQVYPDNDRSAFKRKPRPGYEAMVADIHAGRIRAVVVVDPDRLHREPRELEDFIDLAERYSLALANVSGALDLSTAFGRGLARQACVFARQESEIKSERQLRRNQQFALLGEPTGGRRAYGYQQDGKTVIEDEAARVREAARRFLAGESLTAIARSWNAAGVLSATKGAWRVNSLRQVLTNPRYAGLRVYRGKVIGAAVWPPLLSRADHEQIVARLGNPRVHKRGRPPKYLLTGLVRCGRCKQRMSTSKGSSGERRYTCHPDPGTPGCGGVAITAEALETHVRKRVLKALANDALASAVRVQQQADESVELAERLREDEAALKDLSRDRYARRQITHAEFLAAREALLVQIEAARAELARDANRGVFAGLATDAEGLQAAWDTQDLAWRRALLIATIDHVEVNPSSTRKGRQSRGGADLSRVRILRQGRHEEDAPVEITSRPASAHPTPAHTAVSSKQVASAPER